MNIKTFNQALGNNMYVEIVDSYFKKIGNIALLTDKKNNHIAIEIINKIGFENIRSIVVDN